MNFETSYWYLGKNHPNYHLIETLEKEMGKRLGDETEVPEFMSHLNYAVGDKTERQANWSKVWSLYHDLYNNGMGSLQDGTWLQTNLTDLAKKYTDAETIHRLLTQNFDCSECGGSGDGGEECYYCDGDGCDECDGGFIWGDCDYCGGSGNNPSGYSSFPEGDLTKREYISLQECFERLLTTILQGD